MALFKRNNSATLADTLAGNAAALRAKEQERAGTAAAYQSAASDALKEKADAAKHAEAVEKAQAILDAAGVDI